MAVLVCLVLFLALTGHSTATYCVCKDGLTDIQLQKALDYACGAGADCTAILQNGACYQPNTVKDHCNYAVNSYYQRKGQAVGTCDFSGTAGTVASVTNAASGCTYQSSPTSTGTTTTTNTTTPTTGTTGTTGTTPSTSTSPTVIGLGPTGSGTGMDASGVAVFKGSNLFFSLSLTFWFTGLVLMWG